MKAFHLLTALLLFITVGCQSDPAVKTPAQPMAKLSDAPKQYMPGAEEMRRRCLEQIPPGTSIIEAEEIMTQNGFDCSTEADEQGMYLFCDFKKAAGRLDAQRWQVKIRHTNGVVDNIVAADAQRK